MQRTTDGKIGQREAALLVVVLVTRLVDKNPVGASALVQARGDTQAGGSCADDEDANLPKDKTTSGSWRSGTGEQRCVPSWARPWLRH